MSQSEGKHYSYFCNRECEYFPCHAGIDPDKFSCLFCYCPLYVLGEECGGNFQYSKSGYKDCSNCQVPHRRDNYELIMERSKKIVDMVKR